MSKTPNDPGSDPVSKNDPLAGRPKVRGISVDFDGTRQIDDGMMIWRGDNGGWAVEVSLADVPELVKFNDDLDRHASRRHDEDKPILPRDFTMANLSLNEGVERPAVTVRIKLDADFKTVDTKIFRSAFTNMKACSFTDVDRAAQKGDKQILSWMECAKGLHAERAARLENAGQKALSESTRGVYQGVPSNVTRHVKADADLLVSEVMRLVNRTVADYMGRNNVPSIERKYNILCIEQENSISNPKMTAWLRGALERVHKSLQSSAVATVTLTSPMRSYTDLLNMRNLTDHLEGRHPTHSVRDMAKYATQDQNMRIVQARDPKDIAPPLREHFKASALAPHIRTLAGPKGLQTIESAQFTVFRAGVPLTFAAITKKGDKFASVALAAHTESAKLASVTGLFENAAKKSSDMEDAVSHSQALKSGFNPSRGRNRAMDGANAGL